MKYLALVVLLCLAPACASNPARVAVSPRQHLTLDVLQPTFLALNALQDMELTLFRSGEVPQLTIPAHQQIEAKLAIAFRAHAAASLAVRTWTPGSAVPVDITQLAGDVRGIRLLITSLAIPPNSPLTAKADSLATAVNDLLGTFTGR